MFCALPALNRLKPQKRLCHFWQSPDMRLSYVFSVPVLPITGQKWHANCTFTSIVALIICVVGSFGVMNLDWLVDVTHLIGMSKGKIDVICPTRMTSDNLGVKSTLAQNTLKFCKRLNSKFIVFCKLIDKAITAVSAKPNGICGE